MDTYVRILVQRFGTAQTLADFAGVSVELVKSWRLGRRKPTGPALRLLQVLGLLSVEAPHIFDTFAGKEAPPRCAPLPVITQPERGPWYVSNEAMAARLPEICTDFLDHLLEPTVPSNDGVGSDAWWFPRTVATWNDDPEIVQGLGFLSSWTEEQEAAFLRSLKDYEQRTGRIFSENV